MDIHTFLLVYYRIYIILQSTKHLCIVNISELIRKHQIFFNIDFYEDIDINTLDAYVLPFSHISIVKPRS